MATLASLSEQDIIDQIIAARRESYESRRIKDAWSRKAWNSYNNIHDYSQKEDWQTQIALPKFAMAVDQATQFMRQGISRSARLFGIEVLNDDPVDKLLAAFFAAVINEEIRQMRLKETFVGGLKVTLITNQHISKVGFDVEPRDEIAPFFEMSPVPIIEGGVEIGAHDEPKFREQKVTNFIAHPTVVLVDPLRYYPDPRNLGLYEVQDVWLDYSEVERKFKGFTPQAVLDAISTEDHKYDSTTDSELDERNRQEIMQTENAWRHMTKVTEYWGAFFERGTGKMLSRRSRAVIANDKWVLMRPDQYPYWDGESPYVRTQGISVPFSVWGKLLYQHVDTLAFNLNEIMSLMMDKAKLSALGETAVDVTLIDDMEDIASGLFPGKVWKTRGPKGVEEVRRSGIGADHFQLTGQLGFELQSAHAVTEFLQGQPTSRGRATATEVQEKLSQSAEFFNGIMAEENEGMERVFEKVYNRIMQFKDDWSDPAIMKIAARFGMQDLMGKLNPVERYKLMKRPFRFHAAGLNAAIRRSEILKNLTDMLTVLGNFGPEALTALPIDKIFTKIIEAFDLTELLNTPSTQPQVIVPGPLDDIGPQPFQGGLQPEEFQAGVKERIAGRPTERSAK